MIEPDYGLYTAHQNTACQNRLPCGVCLLTNKLCPIWSAEGEPVKIEPTWTCGENSSGYTFQKEENR